LPQSITKDFHKGTQRNNLANLENLEKILVQTRRGLPRRLFLTARNDGKRTSTLRRAMPYANELWAFSPKNKAEKPYITSVGHRPTK